MKTLTDNLLYTIIDCNGVEQPKYNGQYRTYAKAIKLADELNRSGEYRPYTVKVVNK